MRQEEGAPSFVKVMELARVGFLKNCVSYWMLIAELETLKGESKDFDFYPNGILV